MVRDRWSSHLPLAIAWRYLRGRRSRLLHRTALASLLSVALGVLAMVIAMALMTGYRRDLETKLVQGNAAILVNPLVPERELEVDLPRRLEEVEEIRRARRVAYGHGTVLTDLRPEGEAVTLRGVGAGPDPLARQGAPQSAGEDGVAEAIFGEELANWLGVSDGDIVRLVVLGYRDGRPRFAYRSVRVTGRFHSGFAEFDRHWALLARSVVEEMTGTEMSSLWELELDAPDRAPEIADAVRDRLGADYLVTDWKALNRELFSALRLQQLALFFLLGLIVLVSTFNVASTLMVLVRERMRDVGVLTALGMDRRRLAATFLAYGAALGVIGTAIGATLGALVATVLTRFEIIRFDPEVAEIYFIRSVPFRVTIGDLTAVIGFALLFTVASSAIPAWRAIRVSAASALRYE